MQSVGIITPAFQTALRTALAGITDFTDDDCEVGLVEGEFDPSDPATWPTLSTHFDEAESGGVPTVAFDSVSEQWFLIWPEPTGGWTFTAETITTPVTITGFVVRQGTSKLFANLIGPITVVTTGDVIVLPYIAQAVDEPILVDGESPLPI
jgi:hypothetical protein